ncbi:MAG: ATP synthase F1 subunit delta [Planctomycetota bacterium]
MNISQAAARVYAQALLDIAMTSGDLGRVVEDLHSVLDLYDERPDFRAFFTSPRVDPPLKKRALDAAFRDKLCRPVLGLLHVLVDKRREPVFDNVVDEFDRFRDLREGRVHAHVVSAAPLPENQVRDITERLEKATGKRIVIHAKADPRAIGGIVVKLGDKVIDGTLRRRLESLRRQLAAARG